MRGHTRSVWLPSAAAVSLVVAAAAATALKVPSEISHPVFYLAVLACSFLGGGAAGLAAALGGVAAEVLVGSAATPVLIAIHGSLGVGSAALGWGLARIERARHAGAEGVASAARQQAEQQLIYSQNLLQ